MKFWDYILDKSIVFSFDRTGYRRHAEAFPEVQMRADLSTLHAVVTGANSGIGFATALQLSKLGVTVTIIGRNEQRTEAAAKQLHELGCVKVRRLCCDLSILSQVEVLADALPQVDILVHNAGDMIHELTFTAAGIEKITATHVVGPWRLTELLVAQDKLDLSRDARVIFVSSGGMYSQPLLVERLNEFPDGYDGVKHYALTKRAQVSLAEAFAKRYPNTKLVSVAMHPGWVDTPALRRAMPTFWRLTQRILRTPDQGADTIVWLSTIESQYFEDKGHFFFDREAVAVHLSERTRTLSQSTDSLWQSVASMCSDPQPLKEDSAP